MKSKSLLAAVLLMAVPLVAQDWQCYSECPIAYDNYYTDESESRFFGEIDYLAWYAHQEGLSYGSTYDAAIAITDNAISGTAFDGDDLFYKTKFESGVRAMVGFKPASHSWDIRAKYTYFYSQHRPKEKSSTLASTYDGTSGSNLGTIIIPVYSAPFLDITIIPSSTSLYTLNSRWNLSFNQADLEIGRDFDVACDAKIRTYGGLRGLWTKECFSEVTSLTVTSIGIPVDGANAFAQYTKFGGFGAFTGAQFSYTLGWDLEFYTGFSGSILWGWFNTRQSTAGTTTGLVLPVAGAETFRHSHHSSVFNYDVEIGLCWNYWLNCNKNLLTIRFGWEQHVYTGMNQFQTFATGNSDPDIGFSPLLPTLDHNVQRGDLSLSGFVAGVAFSF